MLMTDLKLNGGPSDPITVDLQVAPAALLHWQT